jgi:CheY-like chemotaxis protein
VLAEGGIKTARSGDRAGAHAAFSECAKLSPENEPVWTWMASTGAVAERSARRAAPRARRSTRRTTRRAVRIASSSCSTGSIHVEAISSTHHYAANGNGSRRLILVVDDSPTIQKVVSVTLEAHGHEVVSASDSMEALSKLRTIRPDLVLLDITMPHMDGYQLCRILRANDLTRQVPIVMLSGNGLFDKMRGRMAGAATYITKPFAPSALPPLIDKYSKRAS